MEVNKEVIENIPKERHMMKVLEEFAELSEVLIKTLNKEEKYRPPMAKIIEEMGDVIYRVNNLAKALGITEQVNKRIEAKTAQINEWYARTKNQNV
jgi:NTP pyrophosphatase (non-canonical NTP hydrolase)